MQGALGWNRPTGPLSNTPNRTGDITTSQPQANANYFATTEHGPYNVLHVQNRLASMLRGWTHEGEPVTTAGVLAFVENMHATVFKRLRIRPQVYDRDTHEWRWAEPADPQTAAMNSWLRTFRTPTQNWEKTLGRLARYYRVQGEAMAVYYGQNHTYEIIPPHLIVEHTDQHVTWTHNGRHNTVDRSQAIHIVNDELEPGIPWSTWFPIIDNLERLDGTFAALDRTTASQLYNSKLVFLRPDPIEGINYRNTHPNTRTPQHAPDGTPQKQPHPGTGNQQANTGFQSIAQQIARLGKARTDPRYRRNQEISGPVVIESDLVPSEVESLTNIDPELFRLIETDMRAIARAQTLSTQFIVDGIGEGNHWSDAFLQDESRDNGFMPMAETICDVFTDLIARPMLGDRLGLVTDPQRIRYKPDPKVLQRVTKTCGEVMEMWRNGIITREYAGELLDLEPEGLLDVDDEEAYEEWSRTVAAVPRTRRTTGGQGRDVNAPTAPNGAVTAQAAAADDDGVHLDYDWEAPRPVEPSLDDQLTGMLRAGI